MPSDPSLKGAHKADEEAAFREYDLRKMFTRRWVCQVLRSGYHNGSACNPDSPHDPTFWRCGYRWEASLPDLPAWRNAFGLGGE